MVEKDLQRASILRARVKPSPRNCLDLLHAPKNVVEQPLEVQKLVRASAFDVDKQAIGHETVRRLELENAKQRLRQVTL
jgi:NH3-dependent NAD+ synthetase